MASAIAAVTESGGVDEWHVHCGVVNSAMDRFTEEGSI
jgi:hypothetical protein